MNARQYLAVFIFFDVFIPCVAFVRFFLLPRPRAASGMVREGFFLTSIILNFANVTLLAYIMGEEVQLRKRIHDDVDLAIALNFVTPRSLKMYYASGGLYLLELWTLKASFVAFYWSLFKHVQTNLKFLLYAVIGVTVLAFLSVVLLFLLYCRPIQNNWSSDSMVFTKCAYLGNRFPLIYQASMNISTDLLVLLLPLLILRSLKLERNVLYALAFVFLSGGLSIMASCIRVNILIRATEPNQTPIYRYNSIKAVIFWTVIEFSTAIFAFCLPVFRPVVLRIFGSGNTRSTTTTPHTPAALDRSEEAQWSSRRRRAQRKNFLGTNVSVGAFLEETAQEDSGIEMRNGHGRNSSQVRLKPMDEEMRPEETAASPNPSIHNSWFRE